MKKNENGNFPGFPGKYRKLLRTMKITLILVTACFVQVSASVYSQNTKFTMDIKNQRVEFVLRQIEDQSEFRFFYQREQVDVERKISLEVDDQTVEQILAQLFKGEEVEFEVRNDNLILLKRTGSSPGNYGFWTGENLQQQRTVSGQVTDSGGEPLTGVTVVVKGTTRGTITDADGAYTLTNVPTDGVLVFSFVGMKTVEVEAGTQTSIDVTLEEETIGLEEVVAIGYGTRQKANLTGSVAAVGSEELTKRTTPNVQNLLQGKVSGLQITQSGGTPGDDAAEMRIRGLGTFSSTGSSPLILIDGVQGSITDLDPNNVESVSVLKDAASAAIYGARAANGVILITTKRGRIQPVSVEYHVTFEAQNATRLPELLTNSADYMELWNEANVRIALQPYFSQEEITAFRNNMDDPVNYPNFDWVDHIFKTAFVQNHHLSVNGGNEKTSFNVAAGFLDQGGIVDLYDFKRYNIRMSVDTKITDWLKVGGNLQALRKDRVQDVQGAYVEAYFIMHAFAPGPNYTPTMTLPDGSTGYVARYSNSIAEWTVRNPDAILAAGSNTTTSYATRPQMYAEVNLTDDLTWYTKGAVDFDYSFNKNHEHEVDNYFFKDGSYAHNGAVWHLGVRDNMNTSFMTTLYSTLNYQKTFNESHNLDVLAGYNQESANYRSLYASRVYFPTNSLKEINAGSTLNQSNSGTASEWAIQSLFGRLAYDYQSKYLFEANVRYDGTSRIAPDTRWGVFPSVSAGWRLSEETFMQDLTWMDNLKLRASWGQLGNQNVGTYPYQDVLSTTSYPFGSLESGVLLTRLVDKTLRWETTSITDFGIDVSVKSGLFTLTADWYDKVTDDILYQVPVPASVGLSAPTVNGGKMKNTGWDFELGHNHAIGNVRYNASLNLSTYKNEVIDIISPSYGRNTVQEGLPYGSWYLTEWIGIFQTQDEIDNGPEHPFGPKPGDLKFKDQNNDGVIDADDRRVFDGRFPDFHYGGSLNLSWRNFNVSTFFQGVSGLKNYVLNWGLSPFTQGSPPTMDLVNNRWTGPGSTNEYPAIYRGGSWSSYKPVEGTESTFHLENASYLRLKNLRIGYTLPSAFSQNMGLKNAEVYFSGDNLLTFTDYPGADPERVSTGHYSVYPQLRTFALGIKVKL